MTIKNITSFSLAHTAISGSATIFPKIYHTLIIKISLNFQQQHTTLQLNFSSKLFMNQIVTFVSLSRPQAKFTTHEKPTLNC